LARPVLRMKMHRENVKMSTKQCRQ